MEEIRNKISEFTSKGSTFFQENPQYAGIIFVLLGFYFIYGAFYRLDKMLEGDGLNHHNIITRTYNLFGYKAAKFVCAALGVFLILLGIGWYFLYTKA